MSKEEVVDWGLWGLSCAGRPPSSPFPELSLVFRDVAEAQVPDGFSSRLPLSEMWSGGWLLQVTQRASGGGEIPSPRRRRRCRVVKQSKFPKAGGESRCLRLDRPERGAKRETYAESAVEKGAADSRLLACFGSYHTRLPPAAALAGWRRRWLVGSAAIKQSVSGTASKNVCLCVCWCALCVCVCCASPAPKHADQQHSQPSRSRGS
ncbi:hypothetical protein BKA80DRAFT_87721 [Phyllosticta citrichinensis]